MAITTEQWCYLCDSRQIHVNSVCTNCKSKAWELKRKINQKKRQELLKKWQYGITIEERIENIEKQLTKLIIKD